MTDRAYDWNTPIENDGEGGGAFHVFPAGTELDFEVLELTRSFSRVKDKDGKAYPMAKLELSLSDGAHTGRCIGNLLLGDNYAWKLWEFFTAIGQCTQNQKEFLPDWERVKGSTGRCRVGVRTYTAAGGTERTANEVQRYLEPAGAGEGAGEQQQPEYEF